MKIGPVIRGALTFVPWFDRLVPGKPTGGSDSANYCYGVWFKHLSFLFENGLERVPRTLAELGPGDSLGIGLAAMLSGVDRLYTLDIVKFSNPERNLGVFDELVRMFKARSPRPGKGWPSYDHLLDERLFPGIVLSDGHLEHSLSDRRISAIREALANPMESDDGQDICISYKVPWLNSRVIDEGSVDVIISQSVLEHVDDLEQTYASLYSWLRDGGMMSHQIDFKSHGLSKKWNGYRACPEFLWKITYGRRPFLINRQPYSVHRQLILDNGFEIVLELARMQDGGIARAELAPLWRGISDDDLNCSGAFFLSRKA